MVKSDPTRRAMVGLTVGSALASSDAQQPLTDGGRIREMAGRFEQAYGSVICKDVKEKAAKDCPEVVARAAGWAAEILVKQFVK